MRFSHTAITGTADAQIIPTHQIIFHAPAAGISKETEVQIKVIYKDYGQDKIRIVFLWLYSSGFPNSFVDYLEIWWS